MYFKTGAHCYIVQGKRQASIYDLSENQMLNIPLADADMLLQLDRGKPVEQVEQINYVLLSRLINRGLGQYYDNNVYIDKIRFGLPPSIKDFAKNKVKIHNLYLNINNNCNLDCVFCRTDDHVNRMTGCKRYSSDYAGNVMKASDYLEIIQSNYKLGCRTLHIIGGEPLLEWNILSFIVEEARSLGYSNIFIYTNLLIIGKLNWEQLQTAKFVIHGVSHTQKLSNQMSDSSYDLSIFEANIEELQKSGLPFYFNLVLNKINYKFRQEIVEYYKLLNPQGIQYSYIHEEGNDLEYNELLFSDKEANNCFTDLSFFHNVDFHPCLNGKLTVFSNGDVTVCPMMRDEVIGNVIQDSFNKILDKRLYLDYWRLTLDQVDSCGNCSSRYGCMDCRAIEKSAGKKITSKTYCKNALKEESLV